MTTHIALLLVGIAASSAVAQQSDTIRVGSVPMKRFVAGVDTFDIEFEMTTPTGPQRTKSISIRRLSLERRGSDSVLRVRFGSDKAVPYWDIQFDPRTLKTLRYEQHTDIDSVLVTSSGNCVTGWADLQHAARKTIACERYTDRFASSPAEEVVITALPLESGKTYTFATYAAVFNTPGEYTFTVLGSDTLTIAGQRFDAWRLERRQTTDYGTLVATMWVDRSRPRLLRRDIVFPNNRRAIATLRNP